MTYDNSFFTFADGTPLPPAAGSSVDRIGAENRLERLRCSRVARMNDDDDQVGEHHPVPLRYEPAQYRMYDDDDQEGEHGPL